MPGFTVRTEKHRRAPFPFSRRAAPASGRAREKSVAGRMGDVFPGAAGGRDTSAPPPPGAAPVAMTSRHGGRGRRERPAVEGGEREGGPFMRARGRGDTSLKSFCHRLPVNAANSAKIRAYEEEVLNPLTT
ncbi:hypothetical protein GCM10017673_52370 [Streptosporangium violaceochromogenes]|nr:hypothetical protein GCM10017673_52370 [Streptosporangium violaceochromogenes]